MPLSLRARHCIGMNWKSFGIEFVQEMQPGKDGHWMERQILNRDKQVASGLRLVRWLKARYGIKNADIVGHATANDSRFFMDKTGIKNAAGDWYAAEVKVVPLAALTVDRPQSGFAAARAGRTLMPWPSGSTASTSWSPTAAPTRATTASCGGRRTPRAR